MPAECLGPSEKLAHSMMRSPCSKDVRLFHNPSSNTLVYPIKDAVTAYLRGQRLLLLNLWTCRCPEPPVCSDPDQHASKTLPGGLQVITPQQLTPHIAEAPNKKLEVYEKAAFYITPEERRTWLPRTRTWHPTVIKYIILQAQLRSCEGIFSNSTLVELLKVCGHGADFWPHGCHVRFGE